MGDMLERVVEIGKEVSNWGRWGDDDERGTLNLTGADSTRRAVDSVVSGQTFSLAIELNGDVPRTRGQPSRRPPLRTSLMVNYAFLGDPAKGAFNDDAVTMGLQLSTHWDALAHCSYGGFIYNGFDASTVSAVSGATKCGIEKTGPVSSRGVLLDLPRAHGVDALDGGRSVGPDDLDAAVELAKVEIKPGDIVLVRTGQMKRLRDGDKRAYETSSIGLQPECARWFRRHDIAAMAVDEQNPEQWPPADDEVFTPLHMVVLRDLGMIQGQNWQLEDLAEACASDGRYTFLVAATPEPFTGAAGAPVAPVAIR